MASNTRSPLRRLLVIAFLAAVGFVAGDVLTPTAAAQTPCNYMKCLYGGPGEYWCSWSGTTHCAVDPYGAGCATMECGSPGGGCDTPDGECQH